MSLSIAGLRKKRAETCAAMEGILSKAKDEDRDLTAEESGDFDALEKEVEDLDVRIKRHERLERLKAAAANPVPSDDPVYDPKPSPEPKEQLKKGMVFGRIVRALAAEKSIRNAAAFAAEAWGGEHPATKALAASLGQSGGFIVPEQYSREIIELLRARAVVRRAGARVMPMSGSMIVPRQVTGSTSTYVGENKPIPASEPSFGQLRLTARKLASLVPISNDLLRTSDPAADQIVVDDMVLGMANTEDSAFIRNTGDNNAPRGMYHWANSDNIKASAGNTLAQIDADIKFLIGALVNNNVAMTNPTWIMPSRERLGLEFLRDANGNLVYPEVGERRQLKGYPIEETNNIPINLGGGTETEVYMTNMDDAVIGEEVGIEITVSDVAAYHDGTEVVAAFSNDQTVMRALQKHDFGLRHDRSTSVLTGVTWGV